MSKLTSCGACGGLNPGDNRACVHCDAPSLSKKFVRLAASGAMAMTLMACYGAMPRPAPPPEPESELKQVACDPAEDSDKDGSCPPHDCDELNGDIHPGAVDKPGDGIDQDCSGADG